jgi:hypothetical protein
VELPVVQVGDRHLHGHDQLVLVIVLVEAAVVVALDILLPVSYILFQVSASNPETLACEYVKMRYMS